MDLYRFVIPLGLVSYGLMFLAVLTGLRVIKVKVTFHKTIGLIGLLGATIHAVIVIYYNYF
jgi:hypothetical protein